MKVECHGVEECNKSEQAGLDAEPTYAEVSRAVRKVAKGRAAGEELITVELLQSQACIEWLHRVVVVTWRGEEAPRDWQDGIVVCMYGTGYTESWRRAIPPKWCCPIVCGDSCYHCTGTQVRHARHFWPHQRSQDHRDPIDL